LGKNQKKLQDLHICCRNWDVKNAVRILKIVYPHIISYGKELIFGDTHPEDIKRAQFFCVKDKNEFDQKKYDELQDECNPKKIEERLTAPADVG
jgi:hypothetical protein